MTKFQRAIDMRGVGVFLQVARDNNFTAAGARLGMTPSAVSKAISRLEADLGATLLRRTPRAVVLTAEGGRFLEEAERLTIAVERARSVVVDRGEVERRKLRVALPINFGRNEVAPRLPLFAERFPRIDLEYLLINHGQLDPIENGVDICLLVGGTASSDSRFVAENITWFETVLCAAPAYLEQFGRPETIAALAGHRTLGGYDEANGRVVPWGFSSGGRAVSHVPAFNMLSNSIEVLLHMAIAGGGIVHAPVYLAAEHLRLGRLQLVLPRQTLEPIPAQIIYARSRATDPEVVAFVGLLLEVVEQRRSATRSASTSG